MKHWTLDDIPWQSFDPAKVDPRILSVVKAASMVEGNGGDYGTYLCNVFGDDPEFQEAARGWAAEEQQHGRALGKWAQLADPDFDFESAFARFTGGFKLPLDATSSVRGSRTGELIARCVVETGTSSYYTALGEAAEEPVLREICHRIAADELRHYKLFYGYLKRYLAREPLGFFARLRIALGRIAETDDDELSYAYFAANDKSGGRKSYDRARCARAYAARAYGFYRAHHIERAVSMVLKAVGAPPNGRIARVLSTLSYRFMKSKIERLNAAEAAAP
jgi:rubrerythrin